jgi:hypothetical protein
MVNALLIMMVKTKPVGISLPRDIIEKIDRERQDIPRSKYLLRILEKSNWQNNNILNSLETGFEHRESSE